MNDILQIRVSPDIGYDAEKLKQFLIVHHKINPDQHFRLVKRSIDARSADVKINLSIDFSENSLGEAGHNSYFSRLQDVNQAEEVHIIGAGPAGLYAALMLIELGLKPIIIERGKYVRARRRDLALLNKQHIINPDSNYCFGEGGAGTYSDGKLYTRSVKRGNIKRILEIFFAHGAKEEIMIDTHPHIGTNKLPGIITSMRETITAHGGEVHFEKKMVDFDIADNIIRNLILSDGTKIPVKQVILATGHSARDIFYMLHQKNIAIEFKPFALGLRIEHPQDLIDQIQYHCDSRGNYLPPAAYSLVSQVNQRGVFSFCMCPGGIVAPCATSPGEVVVNGWSPSKRNNPFANSGIVTEVRWDDVKSLQDGSPLAGLHFQAAIEQLACQSAGGNQTAPAQRLVDFVDNRLSSSLPETSYQPGIASVQLKEILPDFIYASLKQAFKDFGKKMKGYYTNEAVLHGVESRTSSPVRIPRDAEYLHHPQISNLYPCGEGAGYAGGIVSAAMDGQKVAKRIGIKLNKLGNYHE